MKTRLRLIGASVLAALALLATPETATAQGKPVTLLNVSYDPTRELYEEFNAAFAAHWKAKNGQEVTVNQSHGGSGKQARAIVDGLEADVVTLALAGDVDQVAKLGGGVAKDWLTKLPDNSAPYTSTIVFLVRKGNPKGIKDWDDLAKPGVSVITPNPKTSGGARWNYLAAWAFGEDKFGGDQAQVQDFLKAIYKNVAVLDSGARGSTTTFVERGIGDVFISWENEAYLVTKDIGKDQFEIITPSLSILAEPSVAVNERNAKKHGTLEVAKAYLEYLYTPEGQEIAAKHYYRPRNPEVAQKYASQFGQVKLFTIDERFGGWEKATATHFLDGGTFDQIYLP